MKLGRLEKIQDLRDVWKTEAQDFTPWLAGEENLGSLLGETINLDLELEAVEKDVGPFRADILCQDTDDGSLVLVENQVERTDHTHLGQLLTYAAGLNTVTIVWIAKKFTDEHRATLDWLNEITGEKINFFGLEIELWRIGDSAIAPKFNVVSKPNDWTKGKASSSSMVKDTELTPTKTCNSISGNHLVTLWLKTARFFAHRKVNPCHWLNFSIGTSKAHISALLNTQEKLISVCLNIHASEDRIAIFNLLVKDKEAIEPMNWSAAP